MFKIGLSCPLEAGIQARVSCATCVQLGPTFGALSPGFDFLQDVIPHALKEGFRVNAYHHDGFWQDVSTLRAFYDINLELARPYPRLSVSAIHRGIVSRGAQHSILAVYSRELFSCACVGLRGALRL